MTMAAAEAMTTTMTKAAAMAEAGTGAMVGLLYPGMPG